MAKLTDYDYCQGIADLHFAGVKWKVIAVLKSVSYQHLMVERKNVKSILYGILTVGSVVGNKDMAKGIITNIALNGSKDADKLSAAKYMIDNDKTADKAIKTVKSDKEIVDVIKSILDE